jgi:hypothetical protein
MGNKDARKREVKKPKKAVPKSAPAPRGVYTPAPRIVPPPTDKP